MNPIKVYLDEDVHPFIADALDARGWESMTTAESDRKGDTDIDQLRFATQKEFALLTYNVRDFSRLHYELMSQGKTHAGILVATQENPSQTLKCLLRILGEFTADEIRNELVYVNNWS